MREQRRRGKGDWGMREAGRGGEGDWRVTEEGRGRQKTRSHKETVIYARTHRERERSREREIERSRERERERGGERERVLAVLNIPVKINTTGSVHDLNNGRGIYTVKPISRAHRFLEVTQSSTGACTLCILTAFKAFKRERQPPRWT